MKTQNLPFLVAVSLFLIVVLGAPMYAQTPSPTFTPIIVNLPQSQTEPEKLAVLQAQLNLMREYDQRLLNTVYWSLGGMGGVILLVIGLGWYTNFRLYTRELDTLRDSLKREIQATLRAEMSDAAEKAGRDAVREIESTVRTLGRDMKFMKYDLLKTEAERWKVGGYTANAIMSYAEMAEVALEAKFEIYVSEALDNLRKTFREVESIPSGHAKRVTEIINRLPPEYIADVEAIRKLLLEARIK